jgi:hypothetical protein
MTPERLIGLALLVALVLPSLVAASERRRLHDAFRIVLAITGLGYCWATGGGSGLLLGLSSCLSTLIVLTMLVAYTQRYWGARLLSGGEIKTLASGAAWLTPFVAVGYLLLVFGIVMIAGLVSTRLLKGRRNELVSTASSLALLSVFACFH